MPPTAIEPERRRLLTVVLEDLDFLRRGVTLDEGSLRRSSATLRLLLVEERLQAAWRESGLPGRPLIEAPDFEVELAGLQDDWIVYACAGFATLEHAAISAPMMLRVALPLEIIKRRQAQRAGSEPATRSMTLSEYIAAPAMVVHGKRIPRRMVVKYVANRLGGVHVDNGSRRRKDDATYNLLDQALDRFIVGEKRCVYLEIVAAVQALAASRDLAQFSSHARELLSSP